MPLSRSLSSSLGVISFSLWLRSVSALHRLRLPSFTRSGRFGAPRYQSWLTWLARFFRCANCCRPVSYCCVVCCCVVFLWLALAESCLAAVPLFVYIFQLVVIVSRAVCLLLAPAPFAAVLVSFNEFFCTGKIESEIKWGINLVRNIGYFTANIELPLKCIIN